MIRKLFVAFALILFSTCALKWGYLRVMRDVQMNLHLSWGLTSSMALVLTSFLSFSRRGILLSFCISYVSFVLGLQIVFLLSNDSNILASFSSSYFLPVIFFWWSMPSFIWCFWKGNFK